MAGPVNLDPDVISRVSSVSPHLHAQSCLSPRCRTLPTRSNLSRLRKHAVVRPRSTLALTLSAPRPPRASALCTVSLTVI